MYNDLEIYLKQRWRVFRQYEVDQDDIELFKKRHPYTALTMSNDAEIKKYLESGNNECEDIKKAD